MFRFASQRVQLIRAYYDGIGKTVIIYPAAFAISFVMGQLTLGIVFFAQDIHHATPAAIGWISGLWAATYVFGCLVVRPWLRPVPPRYQIVISTSLMGVLSLTMQIVPDVGWLMAIQMALGVGMSLFWPPLMGWLSTGSEGAALGRVFARFNVSWCSGMIISPFVCGWLSQSSSRWPLLLAAGIALATSIGLAIAAAALPSVRRDDRQPENNGPCAAADNSTPLRYPAWAGLFSFYFGLGILTAVFPVTARNDLAYSESLIGLLFVVRATTNAVSFQYMGRTTYWHFRLRPMIVWQCMAAAAMLLLATTGSPWAVGAFLAVFGFATGVGYSGSLFHGVSGSVDRTRRTATHEALIGTGLFLGPVAGGALYEHVSMAAVYVTGAGLLAAVAAGQAVYGLYLHRRRSASNPSI